MSEEEDRTEEQEASEAAATGAGNPTVDEPTEPALEGLDDEAFRDGVPKPGTGKKDDS